jgi:hypothetical protein
MTAATANQSSTLPDAVQSLPEKQQRIYKYLAEKVSTKTYFKSRLIGEELSLSSKEVGTNIKPLLEADTPISIEKWGYSSSTTWKVTQPTA